MGKLLFLGTFGRSEIEIISFVGMLSLFAFIVGMFSPTTVRCSSRKKVALIYLGIFFLCALINESFIEHHKTETDFTVKKKEESKTGNRKEETKEIPDLEKWDKYTINSNNGKIEITFSNIEARRTPKGTLNLVFTLQVKNDTGKNFFDDDAKWLLFDSNGVELDEADVYVPDNFIEYWPSMISVEPYSEEEEAMGYNVKEGAIYYLSMQGEIIAKVPVDKYMK